FLFCRGGIAADHHSPPREYSASAGRNGKSIWQAEGGRAAARTGQSMSSTTTGSYGQIGVLGAGSWGTALALVLHGNGAPSTVWGHDEKTISEITAHGENRTYLPGVPLP